MAAIVLTLGVALVLGHFHGVMYAGYKSMWRVTPKTAGAWRALISWSTTLVVGLALTVAMLALVMQLVFRLWVDVTRSPAMLNQTRSTPGKPDVNAQNVPGAISATNIVVVGAGTPSDHASEDKQADNSGAVANAMTAVGTAVAVLTLMLSLGTTWLAHLQRELGKAVQDAKDGEAMRRALDKQVSFVREKRFSAERAIYNWIRDAVSKETLALWLHEQFTNLKQLSVDDYLLRKEAFGKLVNLFDPWSNELEPVREYTEACHQLQMMRIWYLNRDPGQWAEQERRGVACRVFDSAEVNRVLGV
jgi:hypothetical protein